MKARYLQINNMLFRLEPGQEITSIIVDVEPDGEKYIIIEGYTPDCVFCSTYYHDLTISEWRGFGRYDIWTSQENTNIIAFELIED